MSDLHETYDCQAHNDFVAGMKKLGYGEALHHYRGRGFYTGPAVTLPVRVAQALAAKRGYRTDAMGCDDLVVYP